MNTIFEHFAEDNLEELYFDKLAAKKGSVGVDGITNELFAQRFDEEVNIIQRKVANESYDFSFYKEKLISKGRNSKPRTISIPTNRDKLVLKVLHGFLNDTFDSEIILDSIHRKIKDIKNNINVDSYDFFIKVDIKTFFPSIDHEILKKLLHQKISDHVALNLIDKAIRQTTVSPDDKDRTKYANTKGVPQGLSISGLLASIYLSHIDKKYISSSSYHYYRFVDDILILCNEDESEAIRNEIAIDMQDIGLEIHEFGNDEKKSSYGKIADGFQFLGYKFIGDRITVRESSVDKIYNGINRVFLQHYKYSRKNLKKKKRVKYLYKRLNYKITGCVIEGKQYGWLYFFSFINDQELLHKLDAHVKHACRRFKVPYDQSKIKKFSRAYYELSKMETTNYIPDDEREIKKLIRLLKLAEVDITQDVSDSDKVKKKKKKKKQQLIKQQQREFADIAADIEDDIEFY